MPLKQRSWINWDSPWNGKTHWQSRKEGIPGAEISKEDSTDRFLGYERTFNFWFPWKKVQVLTTLEKSLIWPCAVVSKRECEIMF